MAGFHPPAPGRFCPPGDTLLKAAPLREIIGDWQRFLAEPEPPDLRVQMQSHERTGRPMGSTAFVTELESTLHRPLIPRGAGRKAKKVSVSVATANVLEPRPAF